MTQVQQLLTTQKLKIYYMTLALTYYFTISFTKLT